MLFAPLNYAPLSRLSGATKNLLRSGAARMPPRASFYCSMSIFNLRIFPAIRIGGIADFVQSHTGTQIRFPPLRIIKRLAFQHLNKLFRIKHPKPVIQTLYALIKQYSVIRHFFQPPG
jgi:hypothetical protein